MPETALIEVVDLHKEYRIGEVSIPALRGVMLTIQRGVRRHHGSVRYGQEHLHAYRRLLGQTD